MDAKDFYLDIKGVLKGQTSSACGLRAWNDVDYARNIRKLIAYRALLLNIIKIHTSRQKYNGLCKVNACIIFV